MIDDIQIDLYVTLGMAMVDGRYIDQQQVATTFAN